MFEVNVAESFESFDFASMAKSDVYKLLVSVVMPRPIAWVISKDAEGGLNAAPFSFFNAISSDPPLIVLGFSASSAGEKDTLANLRVTGQFVVNMVSEELGAAMNITAVNAPRGVDETKLAGLEMVPGTTVDVPRIAASPVALECRIFQIIETGGTSTIVLGQVLQAHVKTEAFADLAKLYIDPDKLKLIGRMHGAGGYCTTRDTFVIERKTWPLE